MNIIKNNFMIFVCFIYISILYSMGNIYATEIYSHRGGAGLMPENTLEAYKNSLELKVDAIDIDVAITKDNIIVGSHDPYLNKNFTRDSKNKWLENNRLEIKNFNFLELKQYDVGKINPDSNYKKKYPAQSSFNNIRIPSLDEVIELIKEQNKSNKNIKIQIEIKTDPNKDSNAYIKNFVEHIIFSLRKYDFIEHAELQSFDWRNLLYAKKIEPKIKTSYITEENFWRNLWYSIGNKIFGLNLWTANHKLSDYNNSWPHMIAKLGGDTWCPNYKDLTKELVDEAHANNLRVVPWTANSVPDMMSLIAMGVDGIITDRPDILKKLL